jgi:hypothetical protein
MTDGEYILYGKETDDTVLMHWAGKGKCKAPGYRLTTNYESKVTCPKCKAGMKK